MKCPCCESPKNRISNTRSLAEVVVQRVRSCLDCGYKWHTYETFEAVPVRPRVSWKKAKLCQQLPQ